MPTQRFGWMMVTLLTASTIGNLILLPAILASPLGSIFTWSIRRQARKQAAKAGQSTDTPAEPVAQEAVATTAMREEVKVNGRPVLPHSKLRDTTVRHDAPHSSR
jgi:hypothetical protein